MKKLLIKITLFLIAVPSLYGQGELNEQQRIFFRNERSFAVMLNSDGIGVGYRDARRLNYLNKRFYEIEAATLKHPKEYKLSSIYPQAGSFVFGKLNSVIYIRGGLGQQHELFPKADLGGVAVRFIYSGGPVFALYKPIYYSIIRPISIDQAVLREEKFDVQIHDPTMIYGRASFFKGLNEIKMLPGLYARSGFNFEYSKEDKIIHAVEVGAQVNAFIKKIPIMETTQNKSIFFSFFVSYRFGIVVDPLNPESNKLSNIFGRKRSAALY